MSISIDDILCEKEKKALKLCKEFMEVEDEIRTLRKKASYVKRGQLIKISMGYKEEVFAVITWARPHGVNFFSYVICSGEHLGQELGCSHLNWDIASELDIPEEFKDNVRKAQLEAIVNGGL